MRRTQHILSLVFWGFWAAALIMSAAFESGIADAGCMAGNENCEFVLTALMELATIGVIPVALRLFKMRYVRSEFAARHEAALLKWGLARILLLGISLVADILLYYLFMQPAFGYLAAIVVLGMVFVYPSLGRCRYEVKTKDEE